MSDGKDDKKELTAKDIAARFAAMAGGKSDPAMEQIVDDVTRAELEKWFGLPSFDEAAEKGLPVAEPEDPEIALVRERREKAMAAVDPRLLDAIAARHTPPEDLIKFVPVIDVHVNPDVALFDEQMIARAIAEPRDRELPVEMEDDLKECTPQALLRDLHRAELYFDKLFEVVDAREELTIDASAAVREGMRTSLKLPRLDKSPGVQAREAIQELYDAQRRTSWPQLFKAMPLPNRRVEE